MATYTNKGFAASLNAYRGHHKELSLEGAVQEKFPEEYARINKLSKKLPFEYKLFTFVTGDTGLSCPECGALRQLLGPTRARATCGAVACGESMRAKGIRQTKNERKGARATAAEALLPARPTYADIRAAAQANKSAGRTLLELLVARYPKAWASANRICGDGAPKLSMFEYFLVHRELKSCVVCGAILKYPRSERCKGTCASREALAASKSEGLCQGNGDAATLEKMQHTMLERYGVTGSWGSVELRENFYDTMESRYGVRRAAHLESTIKALEDFNSDTKRKKAAKIKYRKTMEESYGKNWRQVMADHMATARYKWHELTLHGVEFKVQGYEPYAIRHLVGNGIHPKRIKTYARIFEADNGRMYRPDIVVPSRKLVIEVKSVYTAGLQKGAASTHMWKRLQANSALVHAEGEDLQVMVIFPKSADYVLLTNPHTLSHKEACSLLRGEHKPLAGTD